ncbi:MAG TPA: 2-dehydropantoate 2-reductase N-terminal domain-containing protein, partial [Solirubrobacteraceae bacterium]|nr:2-dehydropantoate 2-reductase N-terminal domain-containing protein [Solirubrobacteraceae bacterium]
MRVAVLGPGGVGGLLAAVLPQALVVSREPLAEIRLSSRVLGERTTSVRSTPALAESVDVLFVATKATGLADAVERIQAEP